MQPLKLTGGMLALGIGAAATFFAGGDHAHKAAVLKNRANIAAA